MRWSECKLHGENRLTRDFESFRCKRLGRVGGGCTGLHEGVTSQITSQNPISIVQNCFLAKCPETHFAAAARASIAEDTRLSAIAGRLTKAQFVKVYGEKGPRMTWEQRAAAGVPAKKFQAALAEKTKA